MTDWGIKDYLAKTTHDSETFINSNIYINDYNSYDSNDINLNFDEENERALYFINVPQDNSGNNQYLFSEYHEKDENIKEKNSNNNLNYIDEKIPENISEGKFELKSPNYKNIKFKPRKYFRVDDAKKHFKVAISKLAKEFNIIVVPSDNFGVTGYVRLAYCVSTKTIENSLPAFQKLFDSYKK